jgi:hypothetical protein
MPPKQYVLQVHLVSCFHFFYLNCFHNEIMLELVDGTTNVSREEKLIFSAARNSTSYDSVHRPAALAE